MSFDVAVVLCTHNPRPHFLQRVLKGLQDQSLALSSWELLIVDNQSDRSLAETLNLSWHPSARCVKEETLGLSVARLRGLSETSAPLIVFADDDNVLQSDYLKTVKQIATTHPRLGLWSGQAHPEFESPADPWTQPFWPMLAIREFSHSRIFESFDPSHLLPHGAGMCVRREVGDAYSKAFAQDSWRRLLERQGQHLMSGGDTDMALFALDLGWSVGCHHELRLTHLIPAARLEENYLLRLREASAASSMIIDRGRKRTRTFKDSKPWRWLRWIKGACCLTPLQRRMNLATLRGESRGLRLLAKIPNPDAGLILKR